MTTKKKTTATKTATSAPTIRSGWRRAGKDFGHLPEGTDMEVVDGEDTKTVLVRWYEEQTVLGDEGGLVRGLVERSARFPRTAMDKHTTRTTAGRTP